MAEFKPAPIKPTISFADLDRVELDEVARALIESVTHIAGSADVRGPRAGSPRGVRVPSAAERVSANIL